MVYKHVLCVIVWVLGCGYVHAQDDEWMAPEGKIINYRTLTWSDFLGKPDRDIPSEVGAGVMPAIYFSADSGRELPNGRLVFKFKVKCSFQSSAFVKESVEQEHTNYYLVHEQNHYDIALNYAIKMQAELSARDYSQRNYAEEIDKVADDIYKKYRRTQDRYDGESEHSIIKEKQYLWDMRIKKCLDNNTDEYYASTESEVQSVKVPGQTVKRIPGEAVKQFVVRARPIYTEFPQEMISKTVETREWTQEPAIISFYTQKYYVMEDGSQPKDYYRTLAYAFIPNGRDTYKRVLVDTIGNDYKPVKIAAVFFANADSDRAKELVIITSAAQKDRQASGTCYTNRVYDNVPRMLPGKLKRLDEISQQIDGGFEGELDGKVSKAKYKNEQEVTEALRKMGYL